MPRPPRPHPPCRPLPKQRAPTDPPMPNLSWSIPHPRWHACTGALLRPAPTLTNTSKRTDAKLELVDVVERVEDAEDVDARLPGGRKRRRRRVSRGPAVLRSQGAGPTAAARRRRTCALVPRRHSASPRQSAHLLGLLDKGVAGVVGVGGVAHRVGAAQQHLEGDVGDLRDTRTQQRKGRAERRVLGRVRGHGAQKWERLAWLPAALAGAAAAAAEPRPPAPTPPTRSRSSSRRRQGHSCRKRSATSKVAPPQTCG